MASLKHESPVTLHPEGRLLVVTLNRPPDNRIDRALAAELRFLCASLNEDGAFHVMIVAGGDSGTFSRGTDPAFLEEAKEASSTASAEQIMNAYRCASALASLPFPVLAAIEGDAFDQGLELALAADIRIAGEGAQFRMSQVGSGVIPWDGGTQRLPRAVGPAHATDLIMTGRTIDANEAKRVGLVNQTTTRGNALATARETADAILAGGPIAARYAKEVVNTGLEMTLEQGILLETDLTMILQTTEDRAEGIQSFLERRDPDFKGE